MTLDFDTPPCILAFDHRGLIEGVKGYPFGRAIGCEGRQLCD